MLRSARVIHAGLAWALVVAVVVQVFLAGLAIANLGGNGDFGFHIAFGYTWVGLIALASLISALVARPGRRHLLWVAAVFVDYIVQTLLPGLKSITPAIGALHPVNALLLFGLAVIVARRANALRSATSDGDSAMPAPRERG